MTLFPIIQPRYGLSLSARGLTLVDLRKGWGSSRVRRVWTRALPAGLVQPSVAARSIADVPALGQELSRLLGERGGTARGLPVALSVPDLCAKVVLFEFESWPHKPAEREALLRWRLNKECLLPPTETTLVHRAYRVPGTSPGTADHPRKSAGQPVQVLCLVLRKDTLTQMEEACALSGLLPVSIGLHSLLVFDLCRGVLAKATQSAGTSRPGNTQTMYFLSLAEENFTLLALREGAPAFCRIKPLRRKASLSQEVLATIQFFNDRDAQLRPQGEDQLRPLFIIGDPESGCRGEDSPMMPEARQELGPVRITQETEADSERMDRSGFPGGTDSSPVEGAAGDPSDLQLGRQGIGALGVQDQPDGHEFLPTSAGPAHSVSIKYLDWSDLKVSWSAPIPDPPWSALPAVASVVAGGIQT